MLGVVRVTLAFIWLMICAVFGSIYALLRFRSVHTLQPVAHIFSRVCLPLVGVHVEMRGYEKLLRPGPYVILANHQHNLDIPLYAGIVPPRTITIGKKQIIWVPFFGLIFYATGNLFIDRKNLESAKATFKEAERVMIKHDAHIWVFPEGTRRYGLGLGEFKKGAFHLACETGVPVQPIVTSSLKGHVNLNKLRPGNILMEVLQPIETKGRSVEEVLEEAHAKMKSAIARLDTEIEALSR